MKVTGFLVVGVAALLLAREGRAQDWERVAEAVDVASIVELCDAEIVMLPPVAWTAGTLRIAAASAVEISLRAMLMPTLTLVAFCAEAATARAGASTNASMLAASDALTVTLPA